jgi:hypothetical protein
MTFRSQASQASNSIKGLIQEARALNKRFAETIKPLGATRRDALTLHGESHGNIVRLTDFLYDERPDTQKLGIQEAMEAFPEGMRGMDLEHPEALAKARTLAVKHLNLENANLKETLTRITLPGEKAAKEVKEKGLGILARITEKHNKWFADKTETTRLTVANAEIFLGSIMALQGLFWTLRSLKSQEVTQVVDPDGSMHSEVRPATLGHRASAAASGVATMAAGIGLTGLGFSAVHH